MRFGRDVDELAFFGRLRAYLRAVQERLPALRAQALANFFDDDRVDYRGLFSRVDLRSFRATPFARRLFFGTGSQVQPRFR